MIHGIEDIGLNEGTNTHEPAMCTVDSDSDSDSKSRSTPLRVVMLDVTVRMASHFSLSVLKGAYCAEIFCEKERRGEV